LLSFPRRLWRFFVFGSIFRLMKENVLATLAYYDVLDFPLKAEEVFKFLVNLGGGKTNKDAGLIFAEVSRILDELNLEGVINFNRGFYYLNERDYLVPFRKKKEKISEEKWQQTLKAVKWLKIVPNVEVVFASGSLALNNCDELSDLDLLVVTKNGRIWLTRFLVTGLLSLLRVRRKAIQKIAPNKICLNHYITDKSLKIPFPSIYNAQTYVSLVPILLRNIRLLYYFRKENLWIGGYVLVPWGVVVKPNKLIRYGFWPKLWLEVTEIILDTWLGQGLERFAKKIQIGRIQRNPATQNPNGHVVFDDSQLAFHPDSPETGVLKKYEKVRNSLT